LGPPPPASQAPPPERGRTLGSPTVEAERARGFGGPSLQGSPTRSSAQRARERMFFAVGRTAVPTSSVRLDRVVRSVSASEQSDESGTNSSIRHPPSPSNPRPDSRPGTRHQPLNPANHRPSAPGPHRGSRGTYGVVPRPEGSGEDGVLPGKQGVFGGRSPPLMHEQSAPSQPQPRTLSSVGGAHDLCGLERGMTSCLQRPPPSGPRGGRTVRTTMSSPFRGRWPRSGRRGPRLTEVLPLQGQPPGLLLDDVIKGRHLEVLQRGLIWPRSDPNEVRAKTLASPAPEALCAGGPDPLCGDGSRGC